MKKENILRLKKYLFFISVFFVFLLGTHITYIYLHEGANQSPVTGGAVSEGIIGDFPPHINPLIPSNDYHNTRIIDKLYSSLIKFDQREGKFVGDLANCDLARLDFIECYLKDDIKWSNGKDINIKDIYDTFSMIKNQNTNPTIAKLLEDTLIETDNNIISFSRNNKDINVLNILTQPIVSSELLNTMGTREIHGNFSPINGIYSGKYVIESLGVDESSSVELLNLAINKYNNYNTYIQRYIYKFFNDRNHLARNKEGLNIYYDTQNIIGDSMPRLEKKNLSLNQYVSVFINQENIQDVELRNFILNKIDRKKIISNLGRGYKEIINPYLTEVNMDNNLKNPNIAKLMEKKGYYKKDYLSEINTSNETGVSLDDLNESLNIIIGPIDKKYNFLSEDNILLEGKINIEGVQEISINDYTLNGFSPGDENFYYRIRESFDNISEGENNYKVYFKINGENKLVDEFNLIYHKNTNTLELEKKNIENKLVESYINANPDLQNQKQEILKELDQRYYYNKDLEKYSIDLVFIKNQKEFGNVVNYIVNDLNTYGIKVNPIPITLGDLSNMINESSKNYDMILIGLDHGLVTHNLYPYLHSSQANNGYNLSNTKNLNLDLILEELNGELINKSKIKELQEKSIEIISDKDIIKTLYTKETPLLIDRNINNFNITNRINTIKGINHFLYDSYITTIKTINFKEKGIIDFLKFIINTFKTND